MNDKSLFDIYCHTVRETFAMDTDYENTIEIMDNIFGFFIITWLGVYAVCEALAGLFELYYPGYMYLSIPAVGFIVFMRVCLNFKIYHVFEK